MNNIRHEEYVQFENNLPFYLQLNLKRTPKTCSVAQNWHENIEIQICTNGRGNVLLDGQIYDFKKGDIVIVNSNIIHYTKTASFLEYTCLIVDNNFIQALGFDCQQTLFTPHISNNEKLQTLFYELERTYSEGNKLRNPLLNLILLKLLLEIYENHTLKNSTQAKLPKQFDQVKDTILFLRNNYSRKLSLEEISKNVYMDKYTLSKEFKKITGQTIISFLNAYRCKKAAQFISEGTNVTNSALQCGFENMSFFTKTFQKYMGTLPSAFK